MIPLRFPTFRPTRNFPHVGLRRAAVIGCILLRTWLSAPAQDTSVSISPKPADIPNSWRGLIGEYGPDNDVHYVLEKGGRLTILRKNGGEWSLRQRAADAFEFDLADSRVLPVRFERTGASKATRFTLGARTFERRSIGPVDRFAVTNNEEGHVFQITPVRPVEELRKEALAASPPHESGNFRAPDLVELVTLDPTIRLDIRYATANDFLGTPVYTQARAFLQRPAAEALLRAHRALRPWGYGLLIHDAYRPWYVTKIFWEATPLESRIFVADPAQGSRHNRGCAVDLTLHEVSTGKPVAMVGVYDEMSPRSFPDYPDGTSLQRWHRDLLRHVMEAEGFAVYEHEWWHFDFVGRFAATNDKEWRHYPILNIPFDQVSGGKSP